MCNRFACLGWLGPADDDDDNHHHGARAAIIIAAMPRPVAGPPRPVPPGAPVAPEPFGNVGRGVSTRATPPAASSSATPRIGVVKLAALTFFAIAGGPYGVEPLVKNGGALYAILGLLIVPWFWGLPTALMTAELSAALPESGGYIVWIHRAFGSRWAVQVSLPLLSGHQSATKPSLSPSPFPPPKRSAYLVCACLSDHEGRCPPRNNACRLVGSRQASVWSICNSFLDNAMYPIMFCDYIDSFRGRDWVQQEALLHNGTAPPPDDDGGEPAMTLGRWLLGMAMVLPVGALNLRGKSDMSRQQGAPDRVACCLGCCHHLF
jgi:amino acid transporter